MRVDRRPGGGTDVANVHEVITNPNVIKGAIALIGLVIILVAAHVIRRAITYQVQDATARYKARKLVTLLSYLAATILLSVVFWQRLGGLTVFLGVAGAGVAFALREVIVSVAGWLAISLGGYYRVGNRVQLGQVRGDVIDISLLRTVLMEIGEWVNSDLYTGRVVRVANSFVFTSPVFNYSGDFPFLWDEIRVGVKYGCDWQQAREILGQVAQEVVGSFAARAQDEWRGMQLRFNIEPITIDPVVTLLFADAWLEFTVRYIVDYRRRRLTKDQLFTRILEEFDQTEGRVEIAFPTLRVLGPTELDVRLKRAEEQEGGAEDRRAA
jgi:small-conductance mechanosensitive channel